MSRTGLDSLASWPRSLASLLAMSLLAGAAMLFATVAHAQAEVRAEMTADRSQLGQDEQVAVRILVQTQGSSQPEIEVPEFEGFQVVQRAVQRPIQFSFGFGQQQPVVSSSTRYTFVLQPTRPGTFKIPPVRVTLGKSVYQSAPLQLTVGGSPGEPTPNQGVNQNAPGQGAPQQAAPQAAGQAQPAAAQAPQAVGDAAVYDNEAFLRTVIDKTEPFEGEQLTATIYLYTRRNLQQVPAVQSEASTDGLWTHDLLSATRSLDPTRQVINNRSFWVYVLRRFAAFPLRSGELTLGSMALTISRESVFDLFDPQRAEPDVKRSSVPILLRVKPLPAAGKPLGEIAVGSFEIDAQLDRKQVVTGDAVTLKATVKGQGNVRAVRLSDPVAQGLQVLQPEVHDMVETPSERVQGTRTFAWLIVPKAPGNYTIGPLAFNSFDPVTQTYRRIESAPLTLTAAGNARPDALAQAAPEPEDTDTTAPERAWPPVRPSSELQRPGQRLASRAFYPWAIAAFPVAWLGALLLPALRRRRARDPLSGQRKAMHDAERRLESARAALSGADPRRLHAELAAALLGLLAARLDEPVTGLTHGELRGLLQRRGMPEGLTKSLLGVLSQCDFARFSSSTIPEAEMRGLVGQAERLWPELSAFSPLPAEVA